MHPGRPEGDLHREDTDERTNERAPEPGLDVRKRNDYPKPYGKNNETPQSKLVFDTIVQTRDHPLEHALVGSMLVSALDDFFTQNTDGTDTRRACINQ